VNYGALASIYDRIMSHVGYHRWLYHIQHIIRTYSGTTHPAIFEIGAGTGVLAQKLHEAGYASVSSDLSFAMCRQAARRARPVLCADGGMLPLKDSVRFDLMLFLYDGINYLMSRDEYERLLRQVHAHLSEGGLFLFDVTTVSNSLNNFNDYVDAEDYGDHFYFRHSFYQAEKGIQCNDFTIFQRLPPDGRAPDNGALYKKSKEHHEQRVVPVMTIRDYVPQNRFDIVGMWDNFSFKKHTSHSERVHFLLRKKGVS
jgi:SAM-dependent methyltransferase